MADRWAREREWEDSLEEELLLYARASGSQVKTVFRTFQFTFSLPPLLGNV